MRFPCCLFVTPSRCKVTDRLCSCPNLFSFYTVHVVSKESRSFLEMFAMLIFAAVAKLLLLPWRWRQHSPTNTSVCLSQTILPQIPEESNHHGHNSENLRSDKRLEVNQDIFYVLQHAFLCVCVLCRFCCVVAVVVYSAPVINDKWTRVKISLAYFLFLWSIMKW
jgi:hypothetical protein